MPVNFEEIRKREWPVLETMTFLDAACVSFAPQRSVHALKELADFSARQDEANSSAHHIAMDSKRIRRMMRHASCSTQIPKRSRWSKVLLTV